MKLTSVVLLSMILAIAAAPLATAQDNKAFEDFLKKDAQAWQSYQAILKTYQAEPGLDETMRDFISYHTGLVDNNLMSALQALVKAQDAVTDNLPATKAFTDAKAKFLDICKTAFKKDDDFRKEFGDDAFVTWFFGAAAFLAAENAAFVTSQQDQAKSWRVGSAVLTFETSVLIQAISKDKRDDASLSDLFQKQTINLLKWIYKIPVENRK